MGLPQKFQSWRHGQDLALLRSLDTPKRFIAHAMPTGSGKSLVYVTHALMSNKRALLLTSTKGLQDQLATEFSDLVVDIRGMANYTCDMAHDFPGMHAAWSISHPDREPTVDEGPCHSGRQCQLKQGGCSYYDALRRAKKARVVLANYAYWMAMCKWSEEGLGDFDLMMLDEAHEAPDELAGFLRVDLRPWDLEPAGYQWPRQRMTVTQWTGWAKGINGGLVALISRLETEDPTNKKGTKKLKELAKKLGMMSEMSPDWVLEEDEDGNKVSFEPKWPAPYAESHLFMHTKKVEFYSATIRPKHLELLGVRSHELEFHEYPSPYPTGRRPFIHVPTIRLNWRTTDAELMMWLARADQIIEGRLDRKGIFHTISYDRMRYVVQYSKFRDRMLWNDPRAGKQTRDVVEMFKQTDAPWILVSPSVGTGYDFPGRQCEYQIIGKLPYPDTRSAVMTARSEDDKGYGSFLTMIALVQMAGRGMRGPEDICETLMIDDNITWFIKQNKQYAPQWFLDSIRWESQVPPPLPKLVA